MNLYNMGQSGGVEPLSGSEVKVTISLGGRPLVEADLNLIYLRAKMNGGQDELAVYFTPFAPTEEDETPATPRGPIRGLFIFKILEELSPAVPDGR